MIKNTAQNSAKWFSLDQLVNWSGQRVLLPFYHVVSNTERPHYSHLYPIKSAEEFEQDLDLILEHFKPIGLKELIELKQGKIKPEKNVFHLTFDDGLQELYTTVAPILKKKKVPATFFINTEFLDNKAMFYRFKASILADVYAANGALDMEHSAEKDMEELLGMLGFSVSDYLNVQQPYLTSNQVNELIQDGFTIGAHSKSHPLYKNLSLKEQLDETMGSVDELVRKFNLNYRVFSFPFTDVGVSKDFYKTVNAKLDLTFGTAGVKKDIDTINLQRIPMESNNTAENLLKYHYFKAFIQKIVGKNKIKR